MKLSLVLECFIIILLTGVVAGDNHTTSAGEYRHKLSISCRCGAVTATIKASVIVELHLSLGCVYDFSGSTIVVFYNYIAYVYFLLLT